MTSEEFRNNPLFLRNQFKSVGIFDMPIIRKQNISFKDIKLIGYDQIKSSDRANRSRFVHFFLDDYKFEVLWNDPDPRLEKLKQYKGVLSPQFSTYYTMPLSMQIYNTFRSRWCGAYLQSKGLNVIPTISWGQPQSFWYCFDGIEKGTVVALSTLGVKKEKDFFMQGYNEMLRRLRPAAIICYCAPFPEMKGNIITVDYTETNNLHANKNTWIATEPMQPSFTNLVVKTTGYVLTKGMGGGSSSGGGNRSGMGRSRGNTREIINGTTNNLERFPGN